MVKEEDAEFHARDPKDYDWAETRFISFSIPEEQLFGNVYVLARPNVGAVISDVTIQKGFSRFPYEMDFHDPQMHLPCPPSFRKFTLRNGLSVEAVRPPYELHYSYKHNGGNCSIEFDFTAVGEPFDCHDPKQNPLLGDGTFSGLGDQWLNGHYDVLGHVKGELVLRGKRYTIDSYDGADHSWGPRKEEGVRAMGWTAAAFGPDYGLHTVFHLDLRNGEVLYDKLRFGYVVDGGETYGLVSAELTATRIDMIAVSNYIRAVDVRGKVHEMRGTAIAGHPQYTINPCQAVFQTLFRYEVNGRVGYGESADCFGLDYLAERMSALGRYRAGGPASAAKK